VVSETAVPSLFPRPALIIAAVAFAVVVPFFKFGNPSGHDFEFHMYSWMEVVSQWRQGILYPRWAALAHWGYGEARFLFYPPASWLLGATLGAVLPWKAASGVYVWLVLTASGISMFMLARRWLGKADAIFAAALYAANPYHLVVIYWRSALAELLAGALLPLLVLFVLQLEENQRRATIALSLVVAAAWLTNAPAAVMVNYSLALLIVVLAVVHRSPRLLVSGAIAVVLGAALAAFYLVPAAYEEKWVNIVEVLAPGVRPQDNFLFTLINDPDHNRFNLLVSGVAMAELVVLAGATWLVSRRKALTVAARWMLSVWAAGIVVLMLSPTLALYEYLPKLRFVQLPWRWLLCLNVVLAVMLAPATRRWLTRLALCATMLLVVVFVWVRVQAPWWDNAGDIFEMHDFVVTGAGYEGTDEYVPFGDDAYELKKELPKVVVEGDASAKIQILKWSAQEKKLGATVSAPSKLTLRLFNYPAWKVLVNGNPATTDSTETTGLMVIPVEAGSNDVDVEFTRTSDRTAGGIISVLSALGLLGFIVVNRRRNKQRAAMVNPL
jgi:6-pyruvoyl-tetrahydropterin synthase related domain